MSFIDHPPVSAEIPCPPCQPEGRFQIFRSRNARLFFSGQLVSVTGTWMQNVAQSWLVYRLTGSPWWLGVTNFASQFPVMLLALAGGVVADRCSRRRVVISTQTALMIQAALLAFFTLTGRVSVWHVVALAALMGITNAFDIPARQSLVAHIPDDPRDIPRAIALNASIFNGARVFGPSLAGLVVAASSEGVCFLLNAVSFLAVLIGLSAMKIKQAPSSPSSSLREGWAFAARNQAIRLPLIFVGLSSLTGMSYAILLPIFAREILSGGPRLFGLLAGTVGAGAVAATATLFWTRPSSPALRKTLSLAHCLFGLSLMMFSQSSLISSSLVLAALIGFSHVTLMAGTNTWLQTHVPDALRGRVVSLLSMMTVGMAPVGGLAMGTLAHLIGPVTALLIAGGVTACSGLCYGFMFGWKPSDQLQVSEEIEL